VRGWVVRACAIAEGAVYVTRATTSAIVILVTMILSKVASLFGGDLYFFYLFLVGSF
jgi:hypothetical protein